MVLVLAVMDATERGDGTDCDFWRNKFKVRDRAKDWLGLAWMSEGSSLGVQPHQTTPILLVELAAEARQLRFTTIAD